MTNKKKRFSARKGLSNAFSLLELNTEGDGIQISTISAANDENGASITDKSENKHRNSKEKEIIKNNKVHQKNVLMLPQETEEYRMPLVWIDLEMTGLDVKVDRILEIACIITDGKLIKSAEGPDLVIKQSKECLDNMEERCQERHAASGLTMKVLHSTTTEQDAEKQVIEFVKKHMGTHTPQLAGNSVYTDVLFLKKYMPDLAGIFPHVLVDVSSIKALSIRWFTEEKRKAPKKEQKHRLMDDINESIMELKYYRDNIFKSSSRW